MKNVTFLPWVGKHYSEGIEGRKIMVLGESHYCEPDDVDPEFTTDVVHWYLSPERKHEGWMKTFTCFERAFVGKELTLEERDAFWNSILFYNYVQVGMPGPRVSPTSEEYQKSEEAFFEVLEEYCPDYVIAWGVRLYDSLPNKGYQLPDVKLTSGDEIATWAYETKGGHVVQVLRSYHPSSGYAWEYWHEVIKEFLNRKI